MGKIFPFCSISIATVFWFAQHFFTNIFIILCPEIQIKKSWKMSHETQHFHDSNRFPEACFPS